jgi:hypothetical protein
VATAYLEVITRHSPEETAELYKKSFGQEICNTSSKGDKYTLFENCLYHFSYSVVLRSAESVLQWQSASQRGGKYAIFLLAVTHPVVPLL